jgi:hypothetical protein
MIARDQPNLGNNADEAVVANSQSAHIAALRAARLRHKAIARGLQDYFDAVTAEKVPDDFFALLNGGDLGQVG